MPEFDLTGSKVTSLGVVSVVVASAKCEDFNISSYLVGSITSTSASPTTGIAAPTPSEELSSIKLDIGFMNGSLLISKANISSSLDATLKAGVVVAGFLVVLNVVDDDVVGGVEFFTVVVVLKVVLTVALPESFLWDCFNLLCENGGTLAGRLGVMPSLEAKVSKMNEIS